MKNHASVYIDINQKSHLINQSELHLENNLPAICWVSTNNVIISELNWPKKNLKSSKGQESDFYTMLAKIANKKADRSKLS